jgi:hypothetical protein
MKAVFMYGLILLLGLGLVFIAGCGDDDSTSSEGLTPGNPDDPTFEMVSDNVGEGNFDFDLLLLEVSFGLLDEHFNSGGSPKLAAVASDVIIYSLQHDSSGNWHIFTIDIELLEIDEYDDTTSFRFQGVDSLRLGYPSGYSYQLDTLSVTSLDMHAHYDVEFNAMGEWATIKDHALFTLTTGGGTELPYTINGSTHDTVNVALESDSGSCEASMYYHQTLTNLVLDSVVTEDDGCPPAGTVKFVFSAVVDCQGTDEYDFLNIAGNWVITFVFADNMVKARG